MRKYLFTLAFFGLVQALFAQVMGNFSVIDGGSQNMSTQYRGTPKSASLLDNHAVEININALSNQKADNYTAIFSCLQVGKTAEETDNLLSGRINGLLNSLQALGISRNDVYVDMVNFLPKYEYDMSKKLFSKKTYTEIPKGFELQKNIHVRYSDPSLLDNIVTAAAAQEIYDIVKVDYFVKEPQTVYAQLRAAAFTYLNDVKKSYKTIGMNFDSAYVITAENAWVVYPINRYEKYQAFSSQSLYYDKNSDVVNPADKPVARFYNAVPANDYDIVINPEILEPAVQFSYNLIVRFTLHESKIPPTPKSTKEFSIITPNGDIVPIEVD